MFCPKCGKLLPDNSRFCDSCGAAMNAQPQQSYQQPQQPQNNYQSGYQPSGFEQPQKPKKKSILPIILVAVIAVAAIVGIVAVGGSSKSEGGTVQTDPVQTAEPVQVTEAQQESIAAPQTAEFTVHAYVPDSWSNVGLWAWSEAESKDAFDAWPGLMMEQGADGWYTANAPTWVDHLIINGNYGSIQTEDIDITAQELWIVIDGDYYQLSYEPVETPDSVSDTSWDSASFDNSSYDAIFSSRYIVDISGVSILLDSQSFAMVYDTGMVEKLEYGYDNDVIEEMVYTYYYPVGDYTDQQKADLDASCREMFGEYDALDSCTVEYKEGFNFYWVVLYFTDVDTAATISDLVDIGLLGFQCDYVSMEQTQEGLLGNGYLMK